MSDSTGDQRPDQSDQPEGQQPPAYPPPSGQPGQPGAPYGQQPGTPTYGQPGEERRQSFTEMYGQPQSPYGQPAYAQPGYGPSGTDTNRRPGTVTAAGVLTLVFSGICLLLFGFVLIAFLVARELVVDEMATTPGLEGIDPNDVVTGTAIVMVGFVLWCVVAMVLAVFAMRRSNGARIGLVISAALAAVVSLIAIASLVSGLSLIAAVATIVCLFTGGAGQWYSGTGGAARHTSPVA